MVIDNISNAQLYFGLGRRITAALEFLQSADLAYMPIGRQDIMGDECYALIQEYETKPMDGALWEAHRKYVDVQYIVSGREKMGYANLATMKGMKLATEYNAEKDVVKMQGEGDFFVAGPGTFAIFMPHDAHMPSMAVAEPLRVRKVVVKVLY